jgi:hypothetical protein
MSVASVAETPSRHTSHGLDRWVWGAIDTCIYGMGCRIEKRYALSAMLRFFRSCGGYRLSGRLLDESLKTFWTQTDGEILMVYEPEGNTYVAVGITLVNGTPVVEMDFAAKPKE